MNIIGFILNSLHMLLVFFPFIIFLLPRKWFKVSFKYIMIIYLIVPLHWIFFKNTCILTNMTKTYGNNMNNPNENNFSKKYLKWLYKPFMDLVGWKWNSDIDLAINLHWIIIFICLWYYAFFINMKL